MFNQHGDQDQEPNNGPAPVINEPDTNAAVFTEDAYIKYKDVVVCAAVHYFREFRDCKDRANDAAAEVFIKLFHYRNSSSIENIESWLFVVTRHHCINLLKRERKWKTSRLDMNHTEEPAQYDQFKSSEERQQEAELFQAMDIELDKMNAINRKIIVARFFSKLTIKQIAEKLNLSPVSVKGHLQFTLFKLRSKFKQPK
jgi:RNA polymerase sigma-70 factor (ECF subfamily)